MRCGVRATSSGPTTSPSAPRGPGIRRARSACRSTPCFADGRRPAGRGDVRRRDRRRRPQRARRGSDARARRSLRGRARAPRSARRRRRVGGPRSPVSTCGCRATPTWSACSPRRSLGRSGSSSGCGLAVSPRTPRGDRGLLVDRGDAVTRASLTQLTGDPAAFDAWQRSTRRSRAATRLFPTLTEPLRSREQLRRLVDDDASGRMLFEQPLSEALERTFESDLVRGVVADRRDDRDVRARRRPGPSSEPLLPLPRDRQRHRASGTCRSAAWAL